MQPILTMEFSAKAGEYEFKEESVPLHSPEELVEFVASGGGCEKILNEVEEIRMVFLPPKHRSANNPIAGVPAMLQLHMVIFTGSLRKYHRQQNRSSTKRGVENFLILFLK